MTDINPEDIRAVRREDGGLRALMRAQIDIGRARRTDPVKPAVPRPPGHKPGAWPSGTRPPDPPPPIHPAVIDAALADYRAHVVAAEDRGVAADRINPCQCPACQQLARTEEDL